MLWGTVLFAALAVLQRPIFEAQLLAVGHLFFTLMVVFFLLAAAAGIGWLMVEYCSPEHCSPSHGEQWTIAILLGLGMIGFFWLIMGMIHLPPSWLTILLLLLPVFALWRVRPPRPSRPDLPRPLFILLMVLLLFSFIQSLVPPTSFDALLYHLRLPELWLANENLFQAQKSSPFFHPVLVEALLTPAFQLGGDKAAALLDWVYFPLLLALMWHLTRRFIPEVSAPLVLAIILSIQMIPLLASWTYTDLALAAYQVGTLYALLQWHETSEPKNGWLWIAGAFAGMAMGVKYLSFLTPLMAVLFILLSKRHQAIIPILTFSFFAFFIGSPSYLRNFVSTNNPFFPFALPSPYWDEFRATWYRAAGTGIGYSLRELLAVPWLTTLGVRDTSYYDGRPGVLITTFTPLALWFWARGAGTKATRHKISLLLAFASVYLLFWLLGIISSASLWQGRFLITPLLLLSPVVAYGIAQLEELTTPSFSPARFAYLFIAAWAFFATLIAGAELMAHDPLNGLLSHSNDPAWLERQLGGYERLVQEANRLPQEAKLLLLFEPRSYRMPLQTEADVLLYEYLWRLDQASNNLDGLQINLCTEGYTHIAIYWQGVHFLYREGTINRLSQMDFWLLQKWSRLQQPLWEDETGSHALLELSCQS